MKGNIKPQINPNKPNIVKIIPNIIFLKVLMQV